MKYICQYCGRECSGVSSLKLHEGKCHFNPSNNKYVNYKTEDLINLVSKFKSVGSAIDNGCNQIIEVLKIRNSIPNFLLSKNRPLRNISTSELLNKILCFNRKSEVYKAGYKKELDELTYRNELPEKFKLHNQLSKYSSMNEKNVFDIALKKFKNKTIEESKKLDKKLFNYIYKRRLTSSPYWKIFDKNKRFEPKNKEKVYNVILNNFPGILLPNFEDEYKYFKTSTITCIYNGKTYLKNCKALYTGYGGFNSNNNGVQTKKLWNKEKLDILTEYDLLSMDWAVILDLIGEDKLPNEFKCLCKFGENTPERKKMIDDLKETYNIETTDEEEISEVENNIDDSIEIEVNDINSEENIYNETDEDIELDPLKEIKDIGSLLNKDNEDIFSTGDKWLHIIRKQMNKLWNLILRDYENHSTKNIEIIKSKLNGDITKFERYVYEEFLKEYNEVINLEIH